MSINQLLATQACSDVSEPADIQSRRGLNLLWFPFRALLAIFSERFSVQGIVLSMVSWSLFIGIWLIIYFTEQNWLNSWNNANKGFWPTTVSTLIIQAIVGFLISSVTRTPACTWMVNDATAKLNPNVGPSVFPTQEAVQQNIRNQYLSQGYAVAPPPSLGGQQS